MGALAPVTPWIPKDDLLLKNAIEAGASMESLAKGAVQFSRRFTIKELQDRWHALLYDSMISAEASARMVEFERSQSTLSSKSNKADNSRETKCGLGKRNAESVRRCYYAMRKRICNEPLNHGDLNFLVAPGDSCFVGGAVEAGLGPDSMMGDPITSHYGLGDANFDDLHHVLPQVTPNSVGECPTQNTLEGPIQQSFMHNGISQIVGSDMAIAHNCAATAHTGSSNQVPGHDMFEANGIQANSVCSKDVMCSGFGGNTVFSSTISECETSFHHLQYASSPPTMPDWKSIEGVSVPEIPGDNLRGEEIPAGDPFSIPGDGNDVNRTSEYNIHADPRNHMSCADMKSSAGCGEVYFDDLFNFDSVDEMLIIDGGKDVIDKTYLEGLSSLLLNSPDDVNEDRLHDAPKLEEPAAVDAYRSVPPTSGPLENNNSSHIDVEHLDGNILQSNSQSHFVGTVNPQFPEYRDGVICCVLNTEDPDIPCNDDVIFLSKKRPSSILRRCQSESFSCKDYAGSQTTEKGLSSMKKQFGETHPASHSRLNRAVDELGVKYEATEGEITNSCRDPGTGQGGLVIKNEPLEVPLSRQSACTVSEKPGQGADLSHVQIRLGGFNQEGQTSSAFQNHEMYSIGSSDPMAVEAGGEPLLSDPDEQLSESDADVPYFSDIESMILDMDLGPEDQDSLCSTEVAKYQQEDVKRAIVRLEQNAQSYMRRAIASHGAFAILYGRHSKHYIKKPEVLLGRATDDVSVDIDLGREGRANKISRRQAILKMEKDGTFNLRNLGRCPIHVNSKEINPGQILHLHSNCLMEIRGMPFIFEINEECVKKYLIAAAQRSEAKPLI